MGDRADRPSLARGFGPSALATPANAITAGRVILLPFLVWAMVGGATRLALGIFVLLAATDGLDGLLARRQGATRSGAYLDPLADKVVVLTALAVLAGQGRAPWFAVALMAVREVAVSLWRSVAGRRGVTVPASRAGKLKTVLQLLCVGLFLLAVDSLALVVLWAAVAVSLLSGLDYALRSRDLVRRQTVGGSPP